MKNYFGRALLFLGLLLNFQTAFAEVEKSGVLNQVGERFLTESVKWGTIITGHASWLFWTLVAISMVWTFGLMALRKADIQEFFAEFLKFIIFVGFFWWLLLNGPEFAMSIINSLREIGAEASGLSQLNPSTPISIAFDILAKAAKSYSMTSPIDNLSIFLISLAILACMAVVAANILLALITAYVLAYAGIFVLGFGGSRWTSDIAISYFRSILGVALKLLTMTLLVGIAVSIMDGYHDSLAAKASMDELMIVFVVALVLVILINTIPNVIAGLVPGGSGAASAGSSFGAGALMGAGMTAAGMATGGAAMAAKAGLSAGAGATGAGSAIKAAMAAAQGLGSGGDGGVASSFDSGMGGGSIGGTSGGSASDTPFAQAAGLSDSGSSSGSSSGADGSTGSSGSSGESGADGGAGSDSGSSSGESGGSSSGVGAGGESSSSAGSSETAGSYSSDSSSSDAGSSSGGESGESGSSASGEGGSASDTPFAQAAGLSDSGSKSGIAKAVGVASTLGGAVKSVASDAVKSKVEGFKESVENSTGGKIATKINPDHFKGKDAE